MEDNIAISIKNISKKYRLQQPIQDADGNETHELWALKDISFNIKKGESVGIIGHNGSGKSTLLKILARVTKPTSGFVQINGRVASILDIGAGFHSELSGRENVFMSAQTHLGLKKTEIEKKFDEIVEFSGIGKFIDEPVKNYSNGMYLRLAFSIISHFDFDVYLFDEVLSVGDAEFIFKAKHKTMGLIHSDKTVIVVSHNMQDIGEQEVFVELENGYLKQITRQRDILAKYVQNSIKRNDINVIDKPVLIREFPPQTISNKVELIEISFSQGNEREDLFSYHLPFILNIKYNKASGHFTTDVVITICDISGIILLVTSPILSGMISESEEEGEYTISCKIPPCFFNSNIYIINLTFVKNARVIKGEKKSQSLTLSDVEKLLEDYGIIASYPKLIYFTLSININNVANLSKLNLMAGFFLPAFDWSIENQG
jgi:lipopolysaccharide transport system ATP-binding protein